MRQLPRVDAVVVGFGWTGHIAARALTKAGRSVVALERGGPRGTIPDWQGLSTHDELAYKQRNKLMQDLSPSTLTFRNTPDQTALPMRRLGSFRPGSGVGGAGVHWAGVTYRQLPADFKLRSHFTERYGPGIFDEELSVQDWPVTYDEIEPYYDRFEKLCGTSGQAGNLNGEILEGGNPFEGPRSSPYPTKPLPVTQAGALWAKATREAGLHPYPAPASTISEPYVNTEGLRMAPCSLCGFCAKYACEHFAKASPQVCIGPRVYDSDLFELRTQAEVLRVETTRDGGMATGVTYVDASGQEVFQPAEIVFLCAFAYNNPWLMMLSGIGEVYDPATGRGQIGRDYAYQLQSSVNVFFEDRAMNRFMGSGAAGMDCADYNTDCFDHSAASARFVGGSILTALVVGASPITEGSLPDGTPSWGQGWKDAFRRWNDRNVGITISTSGLPTTQTFLDLDPTYKDAYGRRMMRMTYDFARNDVRNTSWCTDRAVEIARRMGGDAISVSKKARPYSIVPYQSTHNVGGAGMGATPAEGAVNAYQQSWDCPNVFSLGASSFRQMPAGNPTTTVGALALRTMDRVVEDYLRSPGPLVDA